MTRMSTSYDRIEFNEKLIYVHTEACESRDWLKACRLKMIINYVERGCIVKNDLYSRLVNRLAIVENGQKSDVVSGWVKK